jgi:hypothetical protein
MGSLIAWCASRPSCLSLRQEQITWERAGRVKGAERRSGPLTRPARSAQSIAGATVGSASNEPSSPVARPRGSSGTRRGCQLGSLRIHVSRRLARHGLARRSVRARRLAPTDATAWLSVIALSRFCRWPRISAGDSLNRTILPPTTAVAYMTSAYAEAATDASHSLSHSVSVVHRSSGRNDHRITCAL